MGAEAICRLAPQSGARPRAIDKQTCRRERWRPSPRYPFAGVLAVEVRRDYASTVAGTLLLPVPSARSDRMFQ